MIADEGSAWTSVLSVADFASIRAAGFEPVGQVMGSAVLAVDRTRWAPSRCNPAKGQQRPLGRISPFRLPIFPVDYWYRARDRVTCDIADQCVDLGGDGVIGLRLQIDAFLDIERTERIQAFGTAVRARGEIRPPKPFLTHLSGQEFAALINADWVPIDLVVGKAIAVVHEMQRRSRQSNYESADWTSAIGRARNEARTLLSEEAQHVGASGILLDRQDLRTWEVTCPNSAERATDHVAEALFIGTAITRFRRTRLRRPSSLLASALRTFRPAPPPPPSRNPTKLILRMDP